MEPWNFADGNIVDLLETRQLDSSSRDVNHSLQMHSSLVQRLALEKEMQGHNGCVNTIAWNSKGTLLISGSDDTTINIWSYSSRELIHRIDTGHATNIFCTKFIPETSDDLVASGAGDAEVRLFNISRMRGVRCDEIYIDPSAVFQCHSRRVKKLAVEAGNPNVVWSASEDGTLRQHDMREGSSCPPSGSQDCRSVLLDLRCGAKRSLNSSPKQCLSLKSCDISSTRPHQILVGGSDAFARLYDRRMLPSLSSCRTKMPPPPCVCYFCPMHLSESRRSTIHLTHVTFSPDGEEVLLSYSGEHVYLMDISGDQRFQYIADDASKLFSLTYTANESDSFSASTESSRYFAGSKWKQRRLDMYKKLVQIADKILTEGTNLLYGIEACSEILDGKGPEIGNALKHECLCIRAALLLKRNWKNDVHMAIKDCVKARSIVPSSFKAHYLMSEALEQLGKIKEALEYALAAERIAPNSSTSERVSSVRDQLAAAEARKKSKENGGNKNGDDTRKGRVRSLSDVLFRSELNNEESQEGEREDSEFEELEVDFETSVSGDEGHDTESSILHGRVNLRYHRSDDSNRDSCSTNGSQGSPSSSQQGHFPYQSESAIDMKQRYVGHCNIGTDIKQASFLGQQGEFVASGSDDGRWFIWEKTTGRLIKMLTGDEAVVNCIQCHPSDCAVATSGIDNTIKLWSPHAEVPSMVAGGAAGPETADVLSVIESNQHKLRRSQGIFVEPLTVHDLQFAGVRPFECAQT